MIKKVRVSHYNNHQIVNNNKRNMVTSSNQNHTSPSHFRQAWCTRAGCHCRIAAPSMLWVHPARWAPPAGETRDPGREGCNRPADVTAIDVANHGNFNHGWENELW